MPTQNDFLPFATGGGANVLSQAAYAALAAVTNGFGAGVASSAAFNKAWRQSSIMSAVIAQLIVDQTAQPVIDDGTIATIETNFAAAIKALAGAVASSNTTINTVGGATVLSTVQGAASFVLVTGVLANDATLTFPTATQRWTVINNTTGAHLVTCKTAAGTGVTVAQGHADTIVCDNVNITYALYDVGTRAYGDSSGAAASTLYVDRAVGQVGGYYQDTGGVANAYIVALIPAVSVYDHNISFRFRTTRANSGAATIDFGAGPVALKTEGGAQLAANDITTGSIVSVTYDTALTYAVVNELVPSQLGALAKENIGQGLEDDGAGNLRVKLADSSIRRTASGIQANEPVSSVGVAQAVGSANHFNNYQTTTAVAFALAKCSTLWNGFCFAIKAQSGSATLTPDPADTINNGSAGGTFTLNQGACALFIRDDTAGNWAVFFLQSGGSPAADALYQIGLTF